MTNVEIPPEPNKTPIQVSMEFLRSWGKEIGLGLSGANLTAQSFFAGLNLAQGNQESAILHGIAAGGFAIVSLGLEVAIIIEKHSLKK